MHFNFNHNKLPEVNFSDYLPFLNMFLQVTGGNVVGKRYDKYLTILVFTSVNERVVLEGGVGRGGTPVEGWVSVVGPPRCSLPALVRSPALANYPRQTFFTSWKVLWIGSCAFVKCTIFKIF